MFQGKLKILIVEDEPKAQKALEKILTKFSSNNEIIAIAGNLEEAIHQTDSQKIDLIFLDLNLPDGNGFDLINQRKELASKTILVSANDEHGIKALRLGIFDYLPKPYSIDQIQDVIQRYRRVFILESENKKIAIKKGVICIPDIDGYQFIRHSEIVRIESDGNYSKIFQENEDVVYVSKTLKVFQEVLEEEGFIRIHQSHLINSAYILRLNKSSGGNIILTNGEEIKMSSSGKEVFKKLFGL